MMTTKPENLTRCEAERKKMDRRTFVKGAATVATIAATVPLQPLLGGNESTAQASAIDYNCSLRANASFNYRKNMAQSQKIHVGGQADNGHTARFTDFRCSYSKGLQHNGLGVPNPAAMLRLRNALVSGSQTDFG